MKEQSEFGPSLRNRRPKASVGLFPKGIDESYRLARALFERRRERGLSQAEVARLAGLHQADISRIERGLVDPQATTIGRVADVLGARLELIPHGQPVDGRRGSRASLHRDDRQATPGSPSTAPPIPKPRSRATQSAGSETTVLEKRIDPDLISEIARGPAMIDAIVQLTGSTDRDATPDWMAKQAQALLARVTESVSEQPQIVNVLRNLGAVIVAASPDYIRELLLQPEVMAATTNPNE